MRNALLFERLTAGLADCVGEEVVVLDAGHRYGDFDGFDVFYSDIGA